MGAEKKSGVLHIEALVNNISFPKSLEELYAFIT